MHHDRLMWRDCTLHRNTFHFMPGLERASMNKPEMTALEVIDEEDEEGLKVAVLTAL
jgi:hypothetical protein